MLAWKVAICLLCTATGAMIEEAYVFPQILEERSSDGLKLVTIDGKTTLRLAKASVLAETLLVTSYDENGQMTHTLIQTEEIEKHHYRDREQYASLMVRDTGNGLEMTGMVDAVTRIEPVHTAPRSLDGSLPHRLYTMTDEDLERLKKIDSGLHILKLGTATPINSHMASLLAPSSVTADLRERKVMQEVSIISDSEHHKEMTRVQLCAYIVIFMTAVSMRFDQTSNPALEFRVVQVVMATDEQDLLLLQMHNEYVEAYATLKKMYDFTRQYRNSYPDLFLALSGRDLVTVNKDGHVSKGIAGMAQVGGACSSYANFAVVEDRGQSYLGIYFAAHELGHSYGCVHDGDGPAKHIHGHKGSQDADCAFKHGYIMSYLDGGVKRYYFSRCCLEQMRVFLSNQVEACFKNTFQVDFMKTFPNLLPARVTSVNRYCQAKYPDMNNTFYEPDRRKEIECKVVCSGYRTDGSKRSIVTQALDGMICVQGKSCIKGRCITG